MVVELWRIFLGCSIDVSGEFRYVFDRLSGKYFSSEKTVVFRLVLFLHQHVVETVSDADVIEFG